MRGYDETFSEGGGDDDNIRVRLEMAGYTLLACPTLRLLHLSFEPRDGGEHFDPELDFRKCTPTSAVANANVDWGRDFARVALVDESPLAAAGGARDPGSPAAPAPLPAGAVVPTGSRRRCEFCGRLLHYEPPVMACACCAPATAGIAAAAAGRAPRIACLMQLRNEARCLEGCLAHLRGYVDGIVALDDGSTDATSSILGREAGSGWTASPIRPATSTSGESGKTSCGCCDARASSASTGCSAATPTSATRRGSWRT